MKISNYIITVYFTLLFGGVLMLFVGAKFHQKNNIDGQYRGEEKKLEPFSVIVAEPGAIFQISTAEDPRILSLYQLPGSYKLPPYGIKNDTLFVFADPTIDKQRYPDIIYCKEIKSIVAKEKTNLNLQDFKFDDNDTVNVKLINAKINIFYQDPNNNNGSLFLLAEESEISMNGAHLKTMNIQIDQSKVQAWNSSIGSLSGSLENYSEIQATAMKNINVEVDSTSQFNIRK